MPSYVWRCGACSARNEAQLNVCSRCRCPALSSLNQQSAYRAALEGTGSPVLSEQPAGKQQSASRAALEGTGPPPLAEQPAVMPKNLAVCPGRLTNTYFWSIVVAAIGLASGLATLLVPELLKGATCSEANSAACSMLWIAVIPLGIAGGLVWLIAKTLSWPLLVPLAWLLPHGVAFCVASSLGGAALGAVIGHMRGKLKRGAPNEGRRPA